MLPKPNKFLPKQTLEVFKETNKLFGKWLFFLSFTFLPPECESPSCFTSLLTLGVDSLLIFSHSNDCISLEF